MGYHAAMPNYRRYRLPLPVFVTIVTRNRIPWMADERGELVLAAMRRVREKLPFRNHAHVILPDHLHWLFEPPDGADFSAIVAAFKREATWRLKELGLTGPFWQNRFYDHLIRDDDDLHRHLDYIHFNPVKHGLCALPSAWPFSSFATWQKRGAYADDWGSSMPDSLTGMDLE